VLRPVIDGGHTWLAVVMALNVMLGLAYYLRLIVVLVDRPDSEPYVSPSPPMSVRLAKTMVIVGALGLVVLSAWPDLLLSNLP
jgi:NADH-quinone oxidoreductase subunit N